MEPPPVKSRVLVVDDITKNLQIVGTFLRKEGYEVMPAASGAEALKCVRAQLPDLILLDLMMPDMDGLEVCRRLKADPGTKQIPIVFLTASNEMEHLVRGFEVGAVDYVTKPFNPPELLARVRTHLELKHARQHLREMNDEKNEFMGIAAHDLRSPLNAIKGYAEMLLEDTPLNQEQTDLVRRVHDATKRMVEMVQNLLDVNTIERGEMKLNSTPCDLSALTRGVVDTFQPIAAAKQQTLDLEGTATPMPVLVDPALTVQVLENLVSNAIKYSPIGKTVTVCISTSGAKARCAVRDQGPGLSADDQKKLFGKFARLSAKPTAGEPSIGLGLSIVKRMMESMGGRVWCESELGSGATFLVEFPVSTG